MKIKIRLEENDWIAVLRALEHFAIYKNGEAEKTVWVKIAEQFKAKVLDK